MSKFAAYGDLRTRLQGLEFDNFALLLQDGAGSFELLAYFSRYIWVTLYFGEVSAASAIVANARSAGLRNPNWDAAIAAFYSGNPQQISELANIAWPAGIEAIVADALAAWHAAYAAKYAACYRQITIQHATELGLDPQKLGWPTENGIAYPTPPGDAPPTRSSDQETEILVRAAEVLAPKPKATRTRRSTAASEARDQISKLDPMYDILDEQEAAVQDNLHID